MAMKTRYTVIDGEVIAEKRNDGIGDSARREGKHGGTKRSHTREVPGFHKGGEGQSPRDAKTCGGGPLILPQLTSRQDNFAVRRHHAGFISSASSYPSAGPELAATEPGLPQLPP